MSLHSDVLAANYCSTADAMTGHAIYDFIGHPDCAIHNLTDAEIRAYLRAVRTELAVTRLALSLACQDVCTGFSRVAARQTVERKQQPEAAL